MSVVKIYQVVEIVEPDFGCEGRMEGTKICDEVKLMDMAAKKTLTIHVPDAELYQKGIEEGTMVHWDNQIISKAGE